MRAPGWFYARHVIDGDIEFELYDMNDDPFQLENLASRADPANADADPELVAVRARLAARLRELVGCAGSDCR